MSGEVRQFVVPLARCLDGHHENPADPDACLGWFGDYLICDCPCHDAATPNGSDVGALEPVGGGGPGHVDQD